MATHIGITDTYGLDIPDGAVVQDVRKVETVGASEVPGTDGEYLLAAPLKTKVVTVTASGVGAAGLDDVKSGMVANPATMEVLSAEQGEKSTGDLRATFNRSATSMVAFADAAGGGTGAGAGDPDEETLGIVSMTLSLSETLSIRAEVTDVNAPATSGAPGARGKCLQKNSISVRGKGDLPAVTMGTGGLAVAGLSDGLTLVGTLEQGQKSTDINDWAANATNYPFVGLAA